MKNTVLIGAVVTVLAVVGIGAYVLSQDSAMQKGSSSLPSSQNTTNSVNNDEASGMEDTNSSRYVVYADQPIDQVAGTRRVLFFYANWCPTCRPADANFKSKESDIPEDVVLIRVNYNDTETSASEESLARQYGVTYQHTFVQIDANGNEVAKWNGGQMSELLKNIK